MHTCGTGIFAESLKNMRGSPDLVFKMVYPVQCAHWSKLVSQTKFPHQVHLNFLMLIDQYFHVGYANKIEFGAYHNIKLQKTKFS